MFEKTELNIIGGIECDTKRRDENKTLDRISG